MNNCFHRLSSDLTVPACSNRLCFVFCLALRAKNANVEVDSSQKIVMTSLFKLLSVIKPLQRLNLSAAGCAWSSDTAVTQLQGSATSLPEQRHCLKKLVQSYVDMFQVKDNTAVDTPAAAAAGSYCVSYADAELAIKRCGLWVTDALRDVDADVRGSIVPSFAQLLVNLLDAIEGVCAERDRTNNAGDALPAVLPHDLVTADIESVSRALQSMKSRLLTKLSESDIAKIDQEFCALCQAYRSESALMESLDAMRNTVVSFEEAWKPLGNRFEMLKMFYGGLATVLANTATVESDFSVIGLTMDAHRKMLTDLSLEGQLHSKEVFHLITL